MHLNIKDVNKFMEVINSCTGPVYLTDWRSDKNDEPNLKLNLKSQFSMYLGISNLLSTHGDWFEFYAPNREDEAKLLEFYKSQEDQYNNKVQFYFTKGLKPGLIARYPMSGGKLCLDEARLERGSIPPLRYLVGDKKSQK